MALGMTFGGALAVFAFSPSYEIGLLAMLVVGATSASYQSLNNTMAMQTADPAYRGRVMSLFHLTNGAAPLAILPVGYLTDAFGAPIVIGLGGLILLALVFAVGALHPAYKSIG
jgi:MFS family permease